MKVLDPSSRLAVLALMAGQRGQQRPHSMRTIEPGCVRCTRTCQMQQVRRPCALHEEPVFALEDCLVQQF